MKKVIGYFAWNQSSFSIMSGLIFTLILLGYIWWPLASDYLYTIDWGGEWWNSLDWLLIGIFLMMSLLIMGGADLRKDFLLLFIGAAGGFIIESWGTQTEIWSYYTKERPPLWIIPAWPIATLTIDRLIRIIESIIPEKFQIKKGFYWIIFLGFYGIMLDFVAHTIMKPMTIFAVVLCGGIIFTCKDYKAATIAFIAGTLLGYFLERWGTTRECWTYYTLETPPFFAVMAHGMAAVAFWRSKEYITVGWKRVVIFLKPKRTVKPIQSGE